MATTAARSIDALPLELLQKISLLLEREDTLKLRLVAPRSILPYLNAILFENLVVDIDGTDDLPRWYEAEADGVAVKRIHEVAASRISDHVRVLTLRLTRPYSLSGYYEKLGVKRYPVNYVPPKPSLSRRISAIFRPKVQENSTRTADYGLKQPRKRVDYTAELASALRALFKATDLVKTVRLIQPDGFNSQYDIVYPSVYGRVLIRLFTALQSVTIPENASLELLDCPITHLLESALSLDEQTVSSATSKFTSVTLTTRAMGYAIIKPGTTNLQNKPYDGRRFTGVSGLGLHLVKGLGKRTSHLESLKISCETRDKSVIQPFIDTQQDWSGLRHLDLMNFAVDAHLFSHFINKVIGQLKSLSLIRGMLDSKDGSGWRPLFDTWIATKKSEPSRWSLQTIRLADLVDENGRPDVLEAELMSVVQKLVPAAPPMKLRRLM